MLYILIFVIGSIFGTFISRLFLKKQNIGILRIDNSDSDGPYLFLELTKNISEFDKKNQILLNVKNENYIPQK